MQINIDNYEYQETVSYRDCRTVEDLYVEIVNKKKYVEIVNKKKSLLENQNSTQIT